MLETQIHMRTPTIHSISKRQLILTLSREASTLRQANFLLRLAQCRHLELRLGLRLVPTLHRTSLHLRLVVLLNRGTMLMLRVQTHMHHIVELKKM